MKLTITQLPRFPEKPLFCGLFRQYDRLLRSLELKTGPSKKTKLFLSRHLVESNGGVVHILPLIDNCSTTRVIARIRGITGPDLGRQIDAREPCPV